MDPDPDGSNIRYNLNKHLLIWNVKKKKKKRNTEN